MLLFVYGTLKKGFSNDIYMRGAKFLGYAKLHDYDMYTNGLYPFITKGEGVVYGEIYEVTDEKQISLIRGLESGYDETKVTVDNGLDKVDCFAYTFKSARGGIWEKVTSGVFTPIYKM